jgi:hypothetical protein
LAAATVAALAICVLLGGCRSTHYISKRTIRENALANSLNLLSRKGPQLRERTSLVLRRYGLTERYREEPAETLRTLHAMATDAADSERQFAVAELAYIEGKKAEQKERIGLALEYYSTALIASYEYLFAEQFAGTRSPYDPQFRGACDLYNEALEDSLRLLCRDNGLQPGHHYTISTGDREFTIETVVRGNWSNLEIDSFEFVSDYQIGVLNNRHRTFGLGVPLIAVRKPPATSEAEEQYYPEGLSFPVTALVRTVQNGEDPPGRVVPAAAREPVHRHARPRPTQPRCVLEFFDPLTQNEIFLAEQWVPLQTDLTTPLAFFLDTPQFRERNAATKNLIYVNDRQNVEGLFMLEPYDPDRIPVVMVHGLWSSPLTWMDMFNDLRSFPEIRERYQFWFYLYPTGQPFWISATKMRRDLREAREVFDPRRDHHTMDQKVLVGHSMGGLVSRMQTIDSGDVFWKTVSDKPIEQLRGQPDDIQKLVSALKFRPNTSIARVITIATPHHGSEYANDYTRWLGRLLIELPKTVLKTGSRLVRDNPGLFKDTELLTADTSIDSLSPESPIFPALREAQPGPHVRYHNIIGVAPTGRWLSDEHPSDGVVTVASARLENAVSEKQVAADHVSIHTEPATILEVRRILMEHLRKLDQGDRVAGQPAMQPTTTAQSFADATIAALQDDRPAVRYSSPHAKSPPVADPTRGDGASAEAGHPAVPVTIPSKKPVGGARVPGMVERDF